MVKKIEEIFQDYTGKQPYELISVLQEIQNNYGFISEETIISISKQYNIPPARIYGLVTFYDEFRLKPKGRYHIIVCRGTSCHLKSHQSILKELQKHLGIQPGECTKSGMFSLEVSGCMGACHLGPIFKINDDVFTNVKFTDIKKILQNYSSIF